MISVNSNMGALRANDALQQSHFMMQTSLERLSTGIRINRAEDDAAGLMLRDRFQAEVNGFTEGIRNIQTGMGMIQVAEQGLNNVTLALQQMRSLAVRAADANLNNSDRSNIQQQIQGLLKEINDTSQRTNYNGRNLLDGSITDAHGERQASTRVQTNSFLANGNNMISSDVVSGNGATTFGLVSQGSYEVKLVFEANDPTKVDAVIYYSDSKAGSTTPDPNGPATVFNTNDAGLIPVSTLADVTSGTKTYTAGGVSFTVNQVSTLDVSLTSKAYIKAYTYVSAVTTDNSLQFQVGPDEGMTARVGIGKMDVDSVFRRNGLPGTLGGSSDFSDVSVETAISSQDLIGQVDDALQYVGAENLKVGQFQNEFTRLLDLQRQNSTSITGALSNINDADMATEATNQSKRMILVQSGTAMVAQANSTSQFLLQLLR